MFYFMRRQAHICASGLAQGRAAVNPPAKLFFFFRLLDAAAFSVVWGC
jgi:hypothetical protein